LLICFVNSDKDLYFHLMRDIRITISIIFRFHCLNLESVRLQLWGKKADYWMLKKVKPEVCQLLSFQYQGIVGFEDRNSL
jgi:hypothetical protein